VTPSERFRELIAGLQDPAAAKRSLAARTLAELCASDQAPPFDGVLEALAARLARGPDREKDRTVVEDLLHARTRVAGARARMLGLKVRRPADPASIGDRDLTWLVLGILWGAADIYRDRNTLRSILDLATPGQSAIFAIWWTDSEIGNGGLRQYFQNSTGILAPEAIAGFRLVGWPAVADVLERATRLFPPDTALGDRGERLAALDDLSPTDFGPLDDAWFELREDDDALFRSTAAYIRAHPDEFFEP
jgi:hypothetical protein